MCTEEGATQSASDQLKDTQQTARSKLICNIRICSHNPPLNPTDEAKREWKCLPSLLRVGCEEKGQTRHTGHLGQGFPGAGREALAAGILQKPVWQARQGWFQTTRRRCTMAPRNTYLCKVDGGQSGYPEGRGQLQVRGAETDLMWCLAKPSFRQFSQQWSR